MNQTITGEFGELHIETEMVDVTSNLPRPDPSWHYTDAQGHEHYTAAEGVDRWPTLERIVDRTYWCHDCGDEHQETHLACLICSETIEPAMVAAPGHREYRPGRSQAWLNGEPISGERAQELIDAATKRA